MPCAVGPRNSGQSSAPKLGRIKRPHKIVAQNVLIFLRMPRMRAVGNCVILALILLVFRRTRGGNLIGGVSFEARKWQKTRLSAFFSFGDNDQRDWTRAFESS